MRTLFPLLRKMFRVPGTWTTVRDQRRAETLHIAHLFVFLGTMVYVLLPPSLLAGQEVFFVATLIYSVIGSLLLRLGYLTLSAHWTTLVIWAIFAIGPFTEGAITSSSFAGTLAIVVFAGLIFGLRGAFALAAASIATGGLSVYLLTHDLLPPPAVVYTPINIFADFVVFLLFTALFTGKAISSIDSSTLRFEAELQERQRAEAALAQSERSYREIFNSTNEAILVFDAAGTLLDVNEAMLRMYGLADKEQALADPAAYLASGVPPYTMGEAGRHLRNALAGEPQTLIWSARRAAGETFWVETSLRSTRIGGELRILAVVRDITERIRTERMMNESLREKDALLKEIHHRVKNNLQVISSLLSLQSMDLSNAPEAFRESQNRIKSMALIHERLYRSESLAGVEFDEYLHSIVDQLVYSYGKRSVHSVVDARGIVLEIDKAIPCGLIVNELVSNALKHGFPDERAGMIRVSIVREGEGRLVLTVKDDGVGIPPGWDPHQANTLGLTIIKGLTEQPDGTFDMTSGGGACFTIRFPLG